MKQTRILMGMPITVEIADPHATEEIFNEVFSYFTHIDEKFSTYKNTSEISAINTGALALGGASEEMQLIFTMGEETKQQTGGYFDIKTPNGTYDPSGLVKGWAIWNAAKLLEKNGFMNSYIDAGGDIQPHGHNADGTRWAVGIKNPFNQNENIKVVYVSEEGVATSGTYIRGDHIYNPRGAGVAVSDIVSLTVIGPNIHDADRFATAAFAMGVDGIKFIEQLPGHEGYMIDKNKTATMTTGFEKYTVADREHVRANYPMNFIDRFLNSITMYRLVMYYLMILLAIAAVFGAFGILPYNPVAIIFSTLFLLVVAWAANGILARIMNAHPNTESVYITALILALIVTPGMPTDVSTVIFLAWAAVLAMASKYVFAIGKKHIFNPAAFAVAVTALAFGQTASWWIGGNLPMMAFVMIGGLLILRKIQRFDLALTFFIFALASDVLTHAAFDPVSTIQKALIHTPLFFFASVMITEPLTTPPTRTWRMVYGAIVGALFSPFIAIAGISSSPELALLVGNVFSYIVSPKGKHVLTLQKKEMVGNDIYHFTFAADKKISFRAGQYLEWTLDAEGGTPNGKVDSRGNRRYFTIASSPTEDTVQLGIKFYEPPSSFKKQLFAMRPGDTIVAGQLAGEFTLPKDPKQKMAFVAGGIGITPFRSMIKDLVDRGEQRDAILLYSNRRADEIAYRDVFDDAEQKINMKTIYAITEDGNRLTADAIKKEIPDYGERMFYISGTHAMTNTFEKILRDMGVPRSRIKTDFFPGFA